MIQPTQVVITGHVDECSCTIVDDKVKANMD